MKRLLLLIVLLGGCENTFVVLTRSDAETPAEVDGSSRDAGPLRDADGVVDAERADAEPRADAAPPQNVRAVSAFAHTCAIDPRGVYCWGDAERGEFGAVGGSPELRPRLLISGDFISSCNGEGHACALRSDGALYCWGANQAGQLGLSDRTARAQPTPVPTLRFATVACGGHITCAVTSAAELYCWGSNEEGTLGQGDAANIPDSDTPLRVARELRVRDVSVGQAHACSIDQTGALHCWGRNTLGQVGIRSSLLQVRSPTQVEQGRLFERVAAAQSHTCAISYGQLHCWGENSRFAGTMNGGRSDAPQRIGGDEDYQQVAANWFHNCALKRSGALYCWGRNAEEQLGSNDIQDRSSPTRVGSESDWRAMAVGQFHTCAIRTPGLFCWGDNREGQLGLNDLYRRAMPVRVPLP